MEWTNIKKEGQPECNGVYFTWEGYTAEKMHFRNGKWKLRQRNAFAQDMTEFVTHYAHIVPPEENEKP